MHIVETDTTTASLTQRNEYKIKRILGLKTPVTVNCYM